MPTQQLAHGDNQRQIDTDSNDKREQIAQMELLTRMA
jgi:hypothetical protein